jgi:hypothetical protein
LPAAASEQGFRWDKEENPCVRLVEMAPFRACRPNLA